MGGMALAFLAMATRVAAAPLHQDEGGRQGRGFGLELLEAGLELTEQESGVFGNYKL